MIEISALDFLTVFMHILVTGLFGFVIIVIASSIIQRERDAIIGFSICGAIVFLLFATIWKLIIWI